MDGRQKGNTAVEDRDGESGEERQGESDAETETGSRCGEYCDVLRGSAVGEEEEVALKRGWCGHDF